jgi:tubulin-folding cofactor B
MSGKTKPVIRNQDMLAVKAYIMAKDTTQYADVHKDTVILDLTHSNLLQKHIEIRFDLHDTLYLLRTRIHRKTGTPPVFQHLQVQSAGQLLCDIPPSTDDDLQLGYFGLKHGMEVHCVDLDPNSKSKGGQFEDVSLVEKFKMSEEEYDSRKGTLRDWEREQRAKDSTFTLAKHAREHREMGEATRQHKLGLPLPEGFFVDSSGKITREEADFVHPTKVKEAVNDDSEYGVESVVGMEVENRCQVEPGARRGVVSFVGEVSELGGYWVGVTFDEPVGKTDGTAPKSDSGKRYFEALPNYGGFVLGKNVQVGDFPERDIFDEDDDSDQDEL